MKQKYGPDKLRIVWKHFPLPFHKQAKPAHVAAQAVFQAAGSEAFWKFHDSAFANMRQLTPANFDTWAAAAGADPAKFKAALADPSVAAKVDADIVAAKPLGVRGVPAFYINGIFLRGAQPKAKFATLIDAQLAAAKAMRRQGVPADRLSLELSKKNYMARPRAKKRLPHDPVADKTVWKVPVGNSPVLGPNDALVTWVVFSEFQCPFCKRLKPTLHQIRKQYGTQLRIVFKHNPLPFHKRAKPAAQLSIEAHARKGNAGFWAAHEKLFANHRALDDDDLERYARELGLNATLAMAAVQNHKHRARIDADQDLATDLGARGTPHSFLNGRRVKGAQPASIFEKVIEQELVKARQLVSQGTPRRRVYAKIMQTAKVPPPPEQIAVPPVYSDSPVLGNRNAPITIYLFSDLQCPFCARLHRRLLPLIESQKGKVRLVWYNLPLRFHHHARRAATVAYEVRAQRGDRAFWKVVGLIFKGQKAPDYRHKLLDWAVEAGANRKQVELALNQGRFDKIIDRDLAIAHELGIKGTPMSVVHGYRLNGAQPPAAFRKLFALASKDLRAGKSPAKLKQSAINAAIAHIAAEAKNQPPLPPSPPVSTPAGRTIAASHLLIQYAGSKRARHTVTRTKIEASALIVQLLAKARAGADFSKLAARYSDGPSAPRGGQLGTFPRGRMVKPFDDAAFALAPGELSGVVETPFGFHIILRTR